MRMLLKHWLCVEIILWFAFVFDVINVFAKIFMHQNDKRLNLIWLYKLLCHDIILKFVYWIVIVITLIMMWLSWLKHIIDRYENCSWVFLYCFHATSENACCIFDNWITFSFSQVWHPFKNMKIWGTKNT